MRSSLVALVLATLSLSTAIGCSAAPQEDTASDDQAVSGATELSAADRALLMDVLRGKVKPELANQDVVFNVAGESGVLRASGNFAWLQGKVQLRNGGEPSVKGTIYEELANEGVLDGWHIEALLQRQASGWKVVEYGIGSTDVWWEGIDARYPAASRSIFPWRDAAPKAEQLAPSERTAIMSSLRAKEKPMMGGQDIVYNVKSDGGVLRVSGDWCWLQGKIELRSGGEPKVKGTAFEERANEGVLDGWHVEALFHKVNGKWTVVEEEIGSTDVWFEGIWDRHPAAPRAIFPLLDK